MFIMKRWVIYQNLRSNCTYVITNCVHVRNMHPSANLHRVLICSTEFAPPTKVEQISTRVQICTGVHFNKAPFTWPKYTQVQIYTPGVYLHRGVYCAYERGFSQLITYVNYLNTLLHHKNDWRSAVWGLRKWGMHDSKGVDQPVHSRSLMGAFASRLNI